MMKVIEGSEDSRGTFLVEGDFSRFAKYVQGDSLFDCWTWLGHHSEKGYAKLDIRRQLKPVQFTTTGAYRVAYRLYRGVIPEGLQIDHLCRNKGCVNPLHLEVVDARENSRRALGHVGERIRRIDRGEAITCESGHPLTPENTYVYPDGTRKCRTCRRSYHRKWLANKRAHEDSPL